MVKTIMENPMKILWTNGWFGGKCSPYFWFNTHIYMSRLKISNTNLIQVRSLGIRCLKGFDRVSVRILGEFEWGDSRFQGGMGVSKNRGTQKWMVYNWNPIKIEHFEETTTTGNKPDVPGSKLPIFPYNRGWEKSTQVRRGENIPMKWGFRH